MKPREAINIDLKEAFWDRRDFLKYSATALGVMLNVSTTGWSVGAAEKPKVKFGLVGPSLQVLPAIIAEKKALVEGADFKTVNFEGGGLVANATVSGDIDFGIHAHVVRMREKGVSAVALMVMYTTSQYVWVATKDAIRRLGIKKGQPASVKGAKIGYTSPGSETYLLTYSILRQAGLDPDKEVTLVKVGGISTAMAALSKGHIDIFPAFPPMPAMAIKTGNMEAILRIADDPKIGRLPSGWLGTVEKVVKERPDSCAAVVKGIVKSLELIQRDRTEAKAIAKAAFPDVEPGVIESEVDRLIESRTWPRNAKEAIIDEDTYNIFLDMEMKAGIVKQKVPYSQAVDNSIISKLI